MLQKIWREVRGIIIAILLALCIRAVIVEPYRIPSGSMLPTLEIGDFIVVNKMAYNTQIPFTNIFLRQHAPQRGDVAVFKKSDTGLPGSFFGFGPTFLIKRIVGVPGDVVEYRNKTLIINGVVEQVEPRGEYDYESHQGFRIENDRFTATNNGFKNDILKMPMVEGRDVAPMTVPAGHFVFMGDNRDNSRDARFWKYPHWGFIAQEDLAGKAEMVFLHFSGGKLKWHRTGIGLNPERG